MVRALAWRSVSARKGRALLNGLGIVLGVALFFSVLSLSQTIVSTFDELFTSVYGDTDIAVSAGANGEGTLDESLLGKIQKVDSVDVAVGAVASTISHIRKDGKAPGQKDQVFVGGSPVGSPDLSGSKTLSGSSELIPGQLQLDSGWAEANNLKVGDSAKFATATGIHSFKISGIFQIGSGIQFGGQGFGATDIETAREIFDVPTGYSTIDVKVRNGRSVAETQKQIEAVAGSGVQVNTPGEIADQINSQLQGFNIILYFFAAMSLFVGGFLILNSFNMTVAQRLREIGMLRTLGASRKLIRRMILLEAAILGFLGAAIGILLGLLLTNLMVAMVSRIGFPIGDIKYSPAAFIIAPILGIVATILGALRPAIRASHIPPIQAVLVEHRSKELAHGKRLVGGSVMTILGLLGVFTLASSSDTPPPIIAAGVLGVILLFTGVIMIGPVIVPWLVRAMAWPLSKVLPIEGRIAADNARSNPTRTASTASGLMIGIALVAAIGSIGSSMIGSVSDDLDKQLKNDFTVQPRGAQGGPQPSISARALDQIRALPATGKATGVKTMYMTKGDAENQLVYAVDPALHMDFSTPQVEQGDAGALSKELAAGSVTISKTFAKSEGLKVGDKLKLEGPRGSAELPIAALLSGNSMEASSVMISQEKFTELFGSGGYTNILVIAKSPDDRDALAAQLDKLLASDFPTFESLSNQQVKDQIKSQVNQLFSIFYVIMLVAILVSLLGVVNTLLMSVLERTREIGLIRAIGSSRWQVRRMIVAESLLITTAGAILGLAVGMALGWAFVRGIASGDVNVSFHPPVAVIVGVALLTVIAGLFAAIPPARRAAKMNVIDALSYE
jgi:putative ABC transport system permease protein